MNIFVIRKKGVERKRLPAQNETQNYFCIIKYRFLLIERSLTD